MASRLECSWLAGYSLVWQTLQLESGRVPLSDSCQYLLTCRSTFTCSSLRTCKLQTQDLLCSVIVMESFISRLKQKDFIVSFNNKACRQTGHRKRFCNRSANTQSGLFKHVLSSHSGSYNQKESAFFRPSLCQVWALQLIGWWPAQLRQHV